MKILRSKDKANQSTKAMAVARIKVHYTHINISNGNTSPYTKGETLKAIQW